MKDRILSFIIAKVVGQLLDSMSPEQIMRYLDELIDKLESMIIESDNKLDDNLLDVLKYLRDVFGITDYPDSV